MLGRISHTDRQTITQCESVIHQDVRELCRSPIELAPCDRAVAAVLGPEDDRNLFESTLCNLMELGAVGQWSGLSSGHFVSVSIASDRARGRKPMRHDPRPRARWYGPDTVRRARTRRPRRQRRRHNVDGDHPSARRPSVAVDRAEGRTRRELDEVDVADPPSPGHRWADSNRRRSSPTRGTDARLECDPARHDTVPTSSSDSGLGPLSGRDGEWPTPSRSDRQPCPGRRSADDPTVTDAHDEDLGPRRPGPRA